MRGIYLVKRTDPIDWDEYDSVVVVADSATDAETQAFEFSRDFTAGNVDITLVGTTVRRVVMSSYNAG